MSGVGPGSKLGGYRIEEEVGRGGMGIVYRATHLALDKQVALKVVTEELAKDESFRERFKRESRLAASLDHPNVIPVFDAGEVEGRLFISMRYVMGTDLRLAIASAGRMPPSRAAAIVAQVGEALDAAHGLDLVHRDVKPGNVLIEERGNREHVFLTDFGLTKSLTSGGGLTRTGQWVGTTDYIAPEQIRGEHVDSRADVYALGCVLYHALTGSAPYERESDVAKIYAHLSDPLPSVRDAAPDVPAELDAVVAKALAKDPSERHASAGELGRDAVAAAGVAPAAAPTATGPPAAEPPGTAPQPPARDLEATTPPPPVSPPPAGVSASAGAPPETPPPPQTPTPEPGTPPPAFPGAGEGPARTPRKRGIPPAAIGGAIGGVVLIAAIIIGIVAFSGGGDGDSGGGGGGGNGGGGGPGFGGGGGGGGGGEVSQNRLNFEQALRQNLTGEQGFTDAQADCAINELRKLDDAEFQQEVDEVESGGPGDKFRDAGIKCASAQ